MTLVGVDGESTGMPSNESAPSAFDADLGDFRLFLDRLVVLAKSAAHRGSKVYLPSVKYETLTTVLRTRLLGSRAMAFSLKGSMATLVSDLGLSSGTTPLPS